jgi:hypothetical protein
MNIRSINTLTIFNPILHGEAVIINSQTWFANKAMSGWRLEKEFGNWKTQHGAINNIESMAEFIRLIHDEQETV